MWPKTDPRTAQRLHYIGHQDAVKNELTATEMLDYWRRCGQERTVGFP